MKDISNLGKDLSKFKDKLQQNLIKAQKETAEQIQKDVIKHFGHSSGKYADSIKTSNTEKKEDTIKTDIYTELKSKDGYFIGRMIENGTGIYALESHIGHTKTFKESGYQYWYVPTDKVERPIGELIILNGKKYYVVRAQKPIPHWKPALEENIAQYKENIKKAIKESL